jgi:hypothetical protein
VNRPNGLSQSSGILVQLALTSTRLTARVAAKAVTTCYGVVWWWRDESDGERDDEKEKRREPERVLRV